MKQKIKFLAIGVILGLFVGFFIAYFLVVSNAIAPENNLQNELIGGQRDNHGCLGPAGYSWDEELGVCARAWELDDNKKKVVKIAADWLGRQETLTVLEVLAAKCPGCFTIKFEKEQEKISVNLKNWEPVERF